MTTSADRYGTGFGDSLAGFHKKRFDRAAGTAAKPEKHAVTQARPDKSDHDLTREKAVI